ncbi:MAG: GNAT family N-acetyltransferase [Chlamydiales bacterium]|nr:GNAT family N-acetyltransferase [Chlamydiales bacterium]
MKETRKIEVVPYDSDWPKQFESEAKLIKEALGDLATAIHHVGSTSIPGLAAKPKIDIIVATKNPEDTIQKLENIGFKYRGEFNIPMHYGFSKRGERQVNLHVYKKGNPEIELNLTFRDYLRSHPEIRDEYGALKLELLQKKTSFEKNNSMFTGYNLGKNAFIGSVLKRAGFNRLRFVICTHFDEWKAAKDLRKRYFFDKILISDPYEWTFTHPQHLHFVLYKGVEIIGYAHIQLWPEERAAIRIIVIEQTYRHQGHAKQFLKWIETYLQFKGYKSIHTEAHPDSVGFYKRLGYINMPFNDPDGYEGDPRDTPVGKLLQAEPKEADEIP